MIGKWMAGLLVGAAMLTGGNLDISVSASEADDQIRMLLKISGMGKMVAALPGIFQKQSASLAGLLPEKFKPHLPRAMKEAVRVEAFMEIMMATMRQKFDAARMKKTLAWFGSPLGKRLKKLTAATESPEALMGLRTFAAGLRAKPPGQNRVRLIARMVRSEQAADLVIEMTLTTTGGVLRLSNRLQPPEKQVKEEDLQKRFKTMRGQITNPLAQRIVIAYLYAYREVAAEDLEKSIGFFNGEDGKWAKLSLFTGLLTGINQVWASVGDKLVAYSK